MFLEGEMKRFKVLRILGIAVILVLLISIIPTAPAMAQWYHMVLSPDQGAIGDTITISGSGFPATSDPANPQIVIIYFSSQDASVGNSIGTHVTIYKTINQVTTNTLGQFSVSFTIPSTFATGGSVSPGTHYLYACCPPSNPMIQGKTSLTVLGAGEISIDIDEGPVDTLVEITGSSFSASQAITIEFGGHEVDIEDGNTTTGTTGNFVSYIAVPETWAGTHDIDVTVGTGTSAVTGTVQFEVTPDIIISPQSGEAGTSVTISGTGFARRENVDVYYHSTTQVISDLLTDTRGSFYTTFTIPEIEGLTAGAYDIEAEDADLNLASTKFTLNITQAPEPTATEPEPTATEPEPTATEPGSTTAPMNISTSGNIVGSLIGISGAGFIPNTEVIIKYDDQIIATTTSDAAGLIIATFYAPESASGDHIITATDGTVTGTATFTMESEAPPAPTSGSPEPGAKVKSPVSFDWEDVVDNSGSPVTYNLQISTSQSFSEGSIVLEKTGLAYSEYTLNEMEELELAGQEEPYYWRIQAVDVASNESDWTEAGEVYISPPFSFPKWLTYTLLAIGAVVLFVLGYWLGRRTAFMY
jgi:hypothetical protein